MRRDLTVGVIYTGVALAWVYEALNSSGGLARESGNDRMVWTTVAFFGLVHLAVGYFRPSLWMLLLPAILVVVAVPAGYFPTSRPEYPIWFGLAFLAPVLVVATGIGIAARRLTARAADAHRAHIRSA
jgi:hypothetical protein